MKRGSKKTPPGTPILEGSQRLNKLLAAAGLGSRRQVDELIEQGRVEVDGVVTDQLGMKVDASKAKVSVDGVLLKKFRPVYFALNKPSGVLCTNRDPQGRPRAIDLIPGHQRLFPVGRLDAFSVGLLLMTNDGELTQRLTHPKHGVPKTYFVVVAGHIDAQQLRRLQRGIYLAEGLARVEGARIRRERKGATELEITLCEGKNREIRRVLARLGNKVVLLRRTSIGPLKLADLPESAYRPLTSAEVAALYQAADDAAQARRKRRQEKDQASAEDASGKKTLRRRPQAAPASEDSTHEVAPRKKVKATAKPSRKLTQVEPNPDPFAWDDDDALLAASPFGDDFKRPAVDDRDVDGEDFEDDFGGPDLDDANTGDGSLAGAILVHDSGTRPNRGKVLDYADESSPSPKKRSTKRSLESPQAYGNRKRGAKTGGRRFGESDAPKGKRFGRKTTKKFSGKKGGRPTSGQRSESSFENRSVRGKPTKAFKGRKKSPTRGGPKRRGR